MVNKARSANSGRVKPFLKWAGGKTQLLQAISSRLPFRIQQGEPFSYVEPFAGSGAVLFHMLSNFPGLKRAMICDANVDLISAYRIIRDEPEPLIQTLKELENQFLIHLEQEKRKQIYYRTREQFNERADNAVVQAARLIFLNKTCYNGLFRVNSKNRFNVPFGRYKNPLICDTENLRAISGVLQKVELLTGDFEQTLAYMDQESFVYFDPPYRPVSPSASFNAYHAQPFDDSQQKRLKQFCDRLTQQGVSWLLSNSDSSDGFFDALYQPYLIERIPARRTINSNANRRGPVHELLIRNYQD